MKKILYLSLVSSFFFTYNAFAVHMMPPHISEKTAVTTPTTDTTPEYTFAVEHEFGFATYGGGCSSDLGLVRVGDNTITFDALEPGTYSDCTIVVKGAFTTTDSNILHVSTFTILDTNSPVIAEKTPVTTPTTDTTPEYVFTASEAGTIIYGGSCSSATTDATVGDNTIFFTKLSAGTYKDCTITVIDGANNTSNVLSVATFTLEKEVVEGADSASGTTMQKYKRYKEKYKNQKSRDAHKEMKGWKKGTVGEFASYIECRNIYKEYKHLSKRERKAIMTPEDYEKYQMYKKYKGYKEYKKLRDEVK